MRFERLEISNFRSFAAENPTVIEFPAEQNLLAMVGANNAGKSNLLHALRIVLGAVRRDSIEPSDFHQLDLTRSLTIRLQLRRPLKRENIVHSVDEIHGFFFRAWQAERNPGKGQLKTEHYCYDAKGDTYRPMAAVGRRKGQLDPEAEPVPWRPAPAREMLPLLGRVHFLGPSLYSAFDTTGYGPLAQLLDIYRDDFRAEANTYEIREGEIVTRADAYDRFALKLRDILRTPRLAEIEEALSKNLAEVLGPTATGAEVSVALPGAEELLADILALQVQDDAASPVLSVQRLGTGYRSLLRLAIMRTYADLAGTDRPSIFLVEEPEAYLNPHLRRFFSRTLRKLSEQGNDVILTTHDPAFVSLVDYPTVLRATKQAGCTRTYRCTNTLDFSYERLAQKLRHGGNADVLFASRAVLCEGQDDAAAVKALLEKIPLDPDSHDISVVDCDSRDNLPDYVCLLDELGIQILVVSDRDTSKHAEGDTKLKVERVEEAAGDRLFQFQEDIEGALGTEKQKRNAAHLVALIEQMDLNSLEVPDEIRRLTERLRGFCQPQADE